MAATIQGEMQSLFDIDNCHCLTCAQIAASISFTLLIFLFLHHDNHFCAERNMWKGNSKYVFPFNLFM